MLHSLFVKNGNAHCFKVIGTYTININSHFYPAFSQLSSWRHKPRSRRWVKSIKSCQTFHKFGYCRNLSPFFESFSICWCGTEINTVINTHKKTNLGPSAMQSGILGSNVGIFSAFSQYIDYMRTLFFTFRDLHEQSRWWLLFLVVCH